MTDDFLQRADAYRGALRVHCYRMLGRSSDVDDVLQQTMIRAWRARDSLATPENLKAWLYRIATNVCLDELGPPRLLPSQVGAPSPTGDVGYSPPEGEPLWLEPMPSAWLDDVAPVAEDPERCLAQKESVRLAFVAALQTLTGPQRASLLLRDVVGFSAEETAEALGVTVPAVNNALFRARSAVAAVEKTTPPDPILVRRYVEAWETGDLGALVSLLRDDVITTMPPAPLWLLGRAATATFHERMFRLRNGSATPILRPVLANGAQAFGFYRREREDDPRSPYTLRALHVIDVRGGGVARMDHFLTPRVFPLFALPRAIDHLQ